jgi:hypothetical protein
LKRCKVSKQEQHGTAFITVGPLDLRNFSICQQLLAGPEALIRITAEFLQAWLPSAPSITTIVDGEPAVKVTKCCFWFTLGALFTTFGDI